MVDLVPDKCVYELEMNGKTKKHPDHIEPNWTKVMLLRLKWRFQIKTSQIATPNSKLRAFLNVFDGSSVPVGLLHCGGHMKPAQQCTKQLIIALVQSRGQIWTPWWFTIIWTNKLRTRFSNVHFTHFRLHACVRQLDSLEVALVIVSWWEPNCGGASKTSSAKSWPKEITHFSDLAERNHSLFLFPTAYHNLPEHLWQVYEEGVFRHMTSGKSSKSSFGHRVHQLRSWQLCPVQAKALVTNRMGYLSDWNKNKKL